MTDPIEGGYVVSSCDENTPPPIHRCLHEDLVRVFLPNG